MEIQIQEERLMTDEERRRYFRINDEVAMSFSLINEEYGGENNQQDTQDLSQEFHVSLEMQIRQALADVRGQSPKIAHLLDLLNQKMNLQRSNEQASDLEPILKAANISACGISFCWHEKLAINQLVNMSMYLQPRHELIRTEAHVAAVNENSDQATKGSEPYIIHFDFHNIHSAYQELLIQHVVQRQGYQLRKKLNNDQ